MVVVDALLERSALHTKPRLGGAVALDLVHPDELVHASSGGQLVPRDGDPRLVLGVIAELMHLAAPDLSQRLLNKTEQDEPPVVEGAVAKFGEKVLNWLAYGSEQS